MADTCDYEAAERKAREMEQSFERAARGEPEEVKAETITAEDAVTRFLAAKETEGVGSHHMLTLRRCARAARFRRPSAGPSWLPRKCSYWLRARP
jgi:hypothetical protein